MPLLGVYSAMIDQVITSLKTIAELADVTGNPRVFKWVLAPDAQTVLRDNSIAVVMAGSLVPGKLTRYISDNEFQIVVDLIHFANEDHAVGFNKAILVAEKLYDKFHLTDLSGLCRMVTVELFPGEGFLSENLLAIPIRCILHCNKAIQQ